jgi:galactokinase
VFGQLMNASHESCAKDFEISSPELEMLVDTARHAGALGSRLTGAGFGGATVSLVPKDICGDFIQEVTEVYYRVYRKYEGPAPIFVAHASVGAGYL